MLRIIYTIHLIEDDLAISLLINLMCINEFSPSTQGEGSIFTQLGIHAGGNNYAGQGKVWVKVKRWE